MNLTPLLDALVAFAADHDVRVGDPVVLGNTSNIVVHLRPTPIVARVPYITALGRDRPDVCLARELALATHLHAEGVPTIPPSSLLPPGPHALPVRTGGEPTWVSFMEHVQLTPVDLDSGPHAAMVGERLADLVGVAATMDDPAGLFDRSLADETEIGLDRLSGRIPAADIATLRAWAADALIAPVDAQPLHGDPHGRNIGRRADGEFVWFDLDDGVADSPLVDLATLVNAWPAAGAVACRRMGVDPEGPELARYVAQRRMWGGLWTQYYATEVGGRHVAEAAEVLAARRR